MSTHPFTAQLEHWGPDATAERTVSLPEAEAYCRQLARTHYENFPVVSWLLPRRMHRHFYNIYAYCRWADDLGDEVRDPEESLRLLAWWRNELRGCYADLAVRHPETSRPAGSPATSDQRDTTSETGAAAPTQPIVPRTQDSVPGTQDSVRGTWDSGLGRENSVRGTAGAVRGQSSASDESAAITVPPPRHPVFVALQRTIHECNIPQQPFEDLISAFEQDQRVCEYETFEQLLEYCRRSANPVGRLVLEVCGESNGQNVDWADSVCTGLQLANFWQDVARDFDIGRVYLPHEDRERFGYRDEDLRNRVTNDAFLNLMRFEVDRAREYLLAGAPLVERMPGRLQVDVDLFIRGGLKILERIERIGYRVWERRPVVTRRDGLGMLSASLIRRLGAKGGL